MSPNPGSYRRKHETNKISLSTDYRLTTFSLPDRLLDCMSADPAPHPPNLKCQSPIAIVACQTRTSPRIRVVPAGPQLQASTRSPEQKAQDTVAPSGLQLQALHRSGPRQTRQASPGSEWLLPDINDINCKHYVHGPRPTKTASPWSEWPPPNQPKRMPGK